MAELKPCPFCGGNVRFDVAYSYFRDIVIYCDSCDMVFTLDDCETTASEIAEAWNRRATMAEYIEKEAAMLTPVLPKEHRRYQTSNLDDVYEQGWVDALDNLKNAPADDVAPVVHGRWEDSIDEWFETDVYTCSKCRESYVLVEGTPKENLWHYCPNCGAKMDGGEDHAVS